MTACEQLSDRMPDVVRAKARWTAGEAAHLASCADCRAEWDLLTTTLRLGSMAPATDADATAATVLRRVSGDRRARGRQRFWGLGLAAAAALAAVVWTGLRSDRAPAPVAQVEVESGELDSLLLEMDPSQLGASALDEPSLDDLDTNELEQVLRTLEG